MATSFGESFSFKSLKNYNTDSIFTFILTYFVVLRKETEVDVNNSISYCDFYDTYSNNVE